jgi:hypothetical protein
MPEFHTLEMQVSKTTYLFVASWEIKLRHLNSELEVIKACGEGGNSLSQRHFIAETTSPVRSVNKEQEQADHSSS